MAKQSAGIVMHRLRSNSFEVFLVHPGGPFWAKKDEGAWSIPKGEFVDEDPLEAARREFEEETGFSVEGDLIALTPQKQKGGKTVYAWAVQGDCDASQMKSNTFEMQWPPNSGQMQSFPEVDKAEWFPAPIAMKKINQGQAGFIVELARILKIDLWLES